MQTAAEALRESLRHCRCNSLHNHWVHGGMEKPSHPSRVIAYVRQDGESLSNENQIALINEFCQEHGYELINIFRDCSTEPGHGLSDALDALATADALIAVDLERFVHNHKDRLRDLRPLIHNFFCHTQHFLLTISEGVNTGSSAGQVSAVEIFSVNKDFR